MDTIKTLFTADATSTGGRNGRIETSNGALKATLAKPIEMGGTNQPGTTTPEHLFSAAYAACFGGALAFVGGQQKKDTSNAKVTCKTSVGPRDKGGFGISVVMHVEDSTMPQAGRLGCAGERSAREGLPLLARHAQQRSRHS